VYCNPLICVAELARKLGHSKPHLSRYLRKMVSKKHLAVIDYGNARALVAIKAMPGRRNRTPRVLI
jgi:exonuclease I